MTRRHAQIVLLFCGVTWILFSILIAPGIIRSAYDGRNYEIVNRLISGRSEYPVEFYLRKWNIASWMVLIVTIGVLLPVVWFTPHQLFKAWRKYWFRLTPLVYLALFRIIAVGTQLIVVLTEREYSPQHFAGLASLPDSMYKPLPVLQLFLFPFGLYARPSFELLTIIYWVTAVAGMSALLGLKSRLGLLVFAAGRTFLQAFKYSFGDLHHREALMIITLWILAVSPAGSRTVPGQLFRHPKFFASRVPARKSIFAGWPLLLVQNLLSLVYLDAAVRKLLMAGADWVNGYTLQYYLYMTHRGAAASLDYGLRGSTQRHALFHGYPYCGKGLSFWCLSFLALSGYTFRLELDSMSVWRWQE